MVPFCDFLNVSFPFDSSGGLADDLAVFLSSAGCWVESDDGAKSVYQVGSGKVRWYRRGSVIVVAASGAALEHLRCEGVYNDYLSLLGAFPHRVTSLDAAFDVVVLSGPDVLREVYSKALEGGVSLTRKKVRAVSRYLSPNDRGEDTGTVYLGVRGRSEVHAKVYDKRWERLSKTGYDPGELVRYELTVTGKMGPTLKDAACPEAMFWHFASPSLLPSPDGVAAWVGHAEGFELGERVRLVPYQAMQRRVEVSPEVAALGRLAEQVSPGGVGRQMLLRMLRERWEFDAASGLGCGAGAADGADKGSEAS